MTDCSTTDFTKIIVKYKPVNAKQMKYALYASKWKLDNVKYL